VDRLRQGALVGGGEVASLNRLRRDRLIA